MAGQKRRSYIAKGFILLISLAVMSIFYCAFQDFWLSPTEQLAKAYQAEQDQLFYKAERYYRMASQGKEQSVATQAAYRLGHLYRTGASSFSANGEKARLFLEQAAVAGLPEAQYELALMYDVGDQIPENRDKAVQWMRRAAEQGYVNAVYAFGVWIERAYLGTPDMNQVIRLYEQAAAHNHVQAMTSLTALYAAGFQGRAPDPEKAVYFRNKLIALNKQQIQKGGQMFRTQNRSQTRGVFAGM